MSNKSTQTRWRAVLSSALVPAAVVFGLPGLTENWYVKGNGQQGATSSEGDPAWLIATQSIGMFFNLTAAIALLLRILGGSTTRNTLVCIANLVVAVIIDLLCLAIFGASHKNNKDGNGYVLSTAYWLTLTSGIFSLVSAIGLAIDLIKAHHARKNPGTLTPKQRSLALAMFTFMAYIAIGGIVYKYLLSITFLDSIYFVLQTTLTVGGGDILPTTVASKIVLFFYFPIGIILVGILVSLIRETALATIEQRFRHNVEQQWTKHQDGVRKAAQAVGMEDEGEVPVGSGPRDEKVKHKYGWQMPKSKVDSGSDVPKSDETEPTTYEQLLRKSIERNIAAGQDKQSYVTEIAMSFIAFLVFWIVGTLVFQHLEGWTFFIALYYTFTIFTVIGYGDYTTVTPAGRAFYIGWGVFGIVILTILFSLISEAWGEAVGKLLRKRVLRQLIRRERAAQAHLEEDGHDIEARPRSQTDNNKLQRQETDTSNQVPEGNISADLRALDQDIADEDTSAKTLQRDFTMLLNDCESHLEALLEGDPDVMRDLLRKVFVDRDGKGTNDAGGPHHLENDDDMLIKSMLLKHCSNQIAEIKRHASQDESKEKKTNNS